MNAKANLSSYCIFCFLFLSFRGYAQTPIFPSSHPQAETFLAINPTDPANLVGTAITFEGNEKYVGIYYSTDSGLHWNGTDNISGPGAADPMVAFDPDGIAYLLYQKSNLSDLYIRKSTDNWSAETLVAHRNPVEDRVDRPWMAISPVRNSSGFFNIYISVTIVENLPPTMLPSNSIQVFESEDGGASFHDFGISFGSISQHYPHGSSLAVVWDGKLVLAYAMLNKINHAAETIQIRVLTSQGALVNSDYRPTVQIGSKDGNEYFVKTVKVRADNYPRLAIDNGIDPATKGFVYVVWSGYVTGFGPNIFLLRGKEVTPGNWIWEGRGVDETGAGLQWMPAVSVSPGGVLSVLYYTSADEATNTPIYVKIKESYDGGESYQPSHLLNAGFEIHPTEKTFLGDYHGLTSWYGKGYGLWCEYDPTPNPPSNNRQIYFDSEDFTKPLPPGYITVRVDQVDVSNQSFEKFARWNQGAFTEYKAPFDFVFELDTNEVIRAKQDFKTGTTEKYLEWQNFGIINHQIFNIAPNQEPIIASFEDAHNATIQTRLVTPSQVNVGYVEFKDPWLRIEGDPKYYDPPYGYRNLGMDGAELEPYEDLPLELFTASSFKGVFLNQLIEPGKPYYSLAAPQTQDIYLPQSGRTHRFHFRKWDALPPASADFQNANVLQTPLVFRSPNAIVRANYKGTQVGTNYRSNGQKKFVPCQGKLFSVYEDANTIWLESSEDNGLTWNLRNNAQPLGTAGAQCPSLSTDGTTLLITYQENASTIKIVSYDDYDQEIVEVASLSVSNPEEARLYPSSDFSFAAGSVILTGWEVDGAVWCRIGRVWNATYPHIGATYGATHWPLMESNGSGLSLAVANDHSFHLTVSKRTASDRSAVIYRKIRINKMGSDDPDLWELDLLYDVDVSKGGSYPMNIEPCISARHHGDPWIADPIVSWTAGVWTGQQLSYTVASVRVGSQGGQSWGTIQTYSQYPNEIIWTVNNSVYSQQQTVIIWSAGSPPASKWVSRSGAFYSTPQSLSHAGSQVHICPGSSLQNMYAMVFNPPAFTQASTDFSQELPFESPLARSPSQFNLSYGRSGVIYKDSLEFIFHFGDVLVEDSVIGFIPVPDTTVFSSTSQLNQGLISEDFLLQPNSSFQLRTRYEVLNRLPVHSALTDSDRVSFKVELVDAINHTVAGLIDSVTYHKGNLKKQKKNNFQINCSAISPGRYYLRMNLAVTGAAEFTLVNHTRVESQIFAGKTPGQAPTADISAVSSYHLYQNYPNPFNPETTIQFELPKNSAVSLKIYDIQGRLVKTLTNREMPAGAHKVVWDGRDNGGAQVSSGVYIYRMEANNFVESHKMLLIH